MVIPSYRTRLLILAAIILMAVSLAVRWQRGHGSLLPRHEAVLAVGSTLAVPQAGVSFAIEAVRVSQGGTMLTTAAAERTPRDLPPGTFTIHDGQLLANPLPNHLQALRVSLPAGIPPLPAKVLYAIFAVAGLAGLASLLRDGVQQGTAWPSGKTALDRLGIGGRIALYLALSVTAYLGCAAAYGARYLQDRPDANGSLHERVLAYLANPTAYDTIFLGDSRTFTDLHPDLFDALAGTKSVNLAAFANWLPTQFALLEDIVDSIPPGTRVVWSIGQSNFGDFRIWPRVYPLKVSAIAKLLAAGVPVPKLVEAVTWSRAPLRLFTDRATIRQALLNRMIAPRMQKRTGPEGYADITVSKTLAQEMAEVEARYAGRPGVVRAEAIADEGVVNSVVLTLRGGTYYRIELVPDYFRRKQAEMKAEMKPAPASDADDEVVGNEPVAVTFTPDPVRLRLFKAMLDRLHDRGVNVVINEREEAPYNYGPPARKSRESSRAFLRTVVMPIVVERNFPYIRVDFNKLHDDDYFDYNHLNSNGIAKFLPMFVAKLDTVTAR